MIFVLLSIVCSVLVSVVLKLARRYAIDVGQAIAWNYVVTGVLTALVLRPALAPLHDGAMPWLALVGLGVLLPTIFLALAASVRHAGIVRSDAAQRLSLLVSLLAAFVLFGEVWNALKGAGIGLGLAALVLMLWHRHAATGDDVGPEQAAAATTRWLYPLAVFAGFGVIDILFKQVAQSGVPLGSALLAMFALALGVAFILQLARRVRGDMRFTLRSALGGVALGLFNFGNILFYLRGHRALPEHPALVFASMNIGVVALGALVGLLAFRERLSALNLAGVALALLAVAELAGA